MIPHIRKSVDGPRSFFRRRKMLRLALILFACAPLLRAPTAHAQNAPTDQEVSQRVHKLLEHMTLDEKLGQVNQLFRFDDAPEIDEAVRRGNVGSLLFVTDPKVINRLQHLAVEETRLHLPLIFGFDVIHGFRTIFPVPIAMAASWDPAAAVKAQTIAAKEARSAGIDWAFAPMVDIARDPRWGRIVEGAGEDPYLGAAMARAQVQGFQGERIGAPDHLLACMKHFAGYGAAQGGRDYDASYISDSQMWNVYLQPFHAAVQAGVGSAMSAYMDLNDVPATGNRWLLHDVLRDAWKFSGFVVSDANAVKSLQNHGFARDSADAARRGFTAGVDMEMAIGKTAYSSGLRGALSQGKITQQQLDDSVLRILEAKIRLGLFENPYVDEARSKRVLDSPDHRAAARNAAARTIVLLRNEGNLLPLQKAAHKKIAVIGPLGDSQLDTLGPWTFQYDLNETVTVLAGIRSKVGSAARVEFAPGADIRRHFPSFFDEIQHVKRPDPWSDAKAADEEKKAVDLARDSDVAVLVLGETQDMSGEAASRSSLDLPGKEEELLEAVAATGKPIVLVLLNGRPLNISWASRHVPAILEAWYPGTQGGNAVADVLFGDVAPGGKLPISWPRNVGQIPINYAHNVTQDVENQARRYWNEESTPLYPFGFGLSYATFSFSNLKVDHPQAKLGEAVDVAVDVENTGSVQADEVAQLYIHQQYGSASRPIRELKGFERITLAPHQKKTVHFTLGKNELTYWSTATKGWVLEPSTFDVWAGADSTAPLHATFTVLE